MAAMVKPHTLPFLPLTDILCYLLIYIDTSYIYIRIYATMKIDRYASLLTQNKQPHRKDKRYKSPSYFVISLCLSINIISAFNQFQELIHRKCILKGK